MHYVSRGNFYVPSESSRGDSALSVLGQKFVEYMLSKLPPAASRTFEIIFDLNGINDPLDSPGHRVRVLVEVSRAQDGSLSAKLEQNNAIVDLAGVTADELFLPALIAFLAAGSAVPTGLALGGSVVAGIGFAGFWFLAGVYTGAKVVETAIEYAYFLPASAEYYKDGVATGHGLRIPEGLSGLTDDLVVSYFINNAIDPHTGFNPLGERGELKIKQWSGVVTTASYDVFATAIISEAGARIGLTPYEVRLPNFAEFGGAFRVTSGANQGENGAWYYYVSGDEEAEWAFDVTLGGITHRIILNNAYYADVEDRRLAFGQGDMVGTETDLVIGFGSVVVGSDGSINLIIASNSGQRLLGGTLGDFLVGGSGVDDLDGRGGADRVDAGDGDDFVAGDVDDLLLIGGTDRDTLVFTHNTSGSTWTITDDGIFIAGSSVIIEGFEVIVGSLTGHDAFHISGNPGEEQRIAIRGGAGGGDSYFLSGDFSGRVTIEDTGIADRLFVDGVLVSGEAQQSEDSPQVYRLGAFTIARVSDVLSVVHADGRSVRLDDWQNGDYGITLSDEPEEPGPVLNDGYNNGRDAFDRAGQPVTDPLVIDLDGDGLELTSVEDGVLFDIDGDGVLERVGWLGPDDGFLAFDANGDGRIDDVSELFGDPGQLGFAELSTFNTHDDDWGTQAPVIDADDAEFSNLLVWRDLNQNGVSDPGELKTLVELGITSIPLTPATVGRWQAGNLIFEDVLFDREAALRFGAVAEVFLGFSETGSPGDLGPQHGPADGEFALPESRGYGSLTSWSRKAAADAEFHALLSELALLPYAELDSATAITERLLLAWADADVISPDARGAHFHAGKLAVLEALYGRGYVDSVGSSIPTAQAATFLEQSWDAVVAMFRDRALAQGALSSLFTDARYDFDADDVVLDASIEVITDRLLALSASDRLATLIALESFLGGREIELGMFVGQALRDIALLMSDFGSEEVLFARLLATFSDVEAENLVDDGQGGEIVFDGYGQIVVIGSSVNDAIGVGVYLLPSGAYGGVPVLINGGSGNDFIEISPDGSYVFGGPGNDYLDAGGLNYPSSNSYFYGGDGNDILTSSHNNNHASGGNYFYGGDGDDIIYVTHYYDRYSRAFGGNGDDAIILRGYRGTALGEAGRDTITLEGEYSVGDGGAGDDLIYLRGDHATAIGGAGADIFEVAGHFGVTVLGGSGDDTITGALGHGLIDAGDGDDHLSLRLHDGGVSGPGQRIFGGQGNDVIIVEREPNMLLRFSNAEIDPGAGDDLVTVLQGEGASPTALKILTSAGSDTILFDGGLGVVRAVVMAGDTDTIIIRNGGAAVIDLTAFLNIHSVSDLDLTVTAGVATIRLPDNQSIIVQQAGLTSVSGLSFLFSLAPPVTSAGTMGDDTLAGHSNDDTLSGLGGNDFLLGLDGDDSLDGGGGSDILIGGLGDDTLTGGGHDATAPDYFFGGAGDDTYIVNSAMTGAQDLVDEGEGNAALAGLSTDIDTIISQGALFWDFYSVGENLRIDRDAGGQIVGGRNVMNKTITGGIGDDIVLTYGRSSVVDGGAGTDAISFELYGLSNSYEGSNTLIMKPGNGMDYLYGFESGEDQIDLRGFGYGLTGAQWKSFLVDVENGDNDYCFLYLGQPGQYLVFVGVTSAQIQAGDFLI